MKYWLCAFSLVLAITKVASQLPDCSNVGITATVAITFGQQQSGQIPANLGNLIGFRCDVQLSSTGGGAVPSVTGYRWQHNGVLQTVTDANYRIASPQSSDGGEYRCAGVTDTCVTSFSDARDVTTPPTVTGLVSDPQEVFENDRLTLTCQAEGWPTPTIMWFKVGSDGTQTNIGSGPQLTINQTSLSDAGIYECQATNSRGAKERRTQVDISPEPTTPPIATTVPEPEETTTEDADTQTPVEGSGTEATTVEPTPRVEFYIAVAVTFVVCFTIALLVVIMSIVGLCVIYKRERKGDDVAPEYYEDEEELVEMETLETEMPKPKKKKNRARRKF